MSLIAMSAAGTTPDEFRPYCPKDVMNMKVRFADWTQPTMARCRAIIKKAARKWRKAIVSDPYGLFRRVHATSQNLPLPLQ